MVQGQCCAIRVCFSWPDLANSTDVHFRSCWHSFCLSCTCHELAYCRKVLQLPLINVVQNEMQSSVWLTSFLERVQPWKIWLREPSDVPAEARFSNYCSCCTLSSLQTWLGENPSPYLKLKEVWNFPTLVQQKVHELVGYGGFSHDKPTFGHNHFRDRSLRPTVTTWKLSFTLLWGSWMRWPVWIENESFQSSSGGKWSPRWQRRLVVRVWLLRKFDPSRKFSWRSSRGNIRFQTRSGMNSQVLRWQAMERQKLEPWKWEGSPKGLAEWLLFCWGWRTYFQNSVMKSI